MLSNNNLLLFSLQKHIEEMNKAEDQLEEYENRALEAERTLEEVKEELLKVRLFENPKVSVCIGIH